MYINIYIVCVSCHKTVLMMLSLSSVGDFRRDFGMNVELQGVMQDASVMRISDNVHNKTRSLHCTAVSLFHSYSFCCVVSFFLWIFMSVCVCVTESAGV